MDQLSLVITYILFVWLVIIHTFEEIACNIFEEQIGHIVVKKHKYLLAASGISTLNMGTLVLIVIGHPIGIYFGLFTSGFFGILQGIVHSIGFIREHGKMRRLGAGFFSAIPLTLCGAVLFWLLLNQLIND